MGQGGNWEKGKRGKREKRGIKGERGGGREKSPVSTE